MVVCLTAISFSLMSHLDKWGAEFSLLGPQLRPYWAHYLSFFRTLCDINATKQLFSSQCAGCFRFVSQCRDYLQTAPCTAYVYIPITESQLTFARPVSNINRLVRQSN